MKKKYYVVFKERRKGVYDNWLDCQAQVNGVPNQYKGFFSWEEVKDAVLFDMADNGPYIYSVLGKVIIFKTYERFRDYVLNRN